MVRDAAGAENQELCKDQGIDLQGFKYGKKTTKMEINRIAMGIYWDLCGYITITMIFRGNKHESPRFFDANRRVTGFWPIAITAVQTGRDHHGGVTCFTWVGICIMNIYEYLWMTIRWSINMHYPDERIQREPKPASKDCGVALAWKGSIRCIHKHINHQEASQESGYQGSYGWMTRMLFGLFH